MMTEEIEIQQPQSAGKRFYYGVLGLIFAISNTIAVVLMAVVICTLLGLKVYKIFYWIGVALLHLFTYPKFSSASPRNKYLMLLVSVAVLTVAILMAVFLKKV